MSESRKVTITLSDAQVAQVLNHASDGPGFTKLFAGLGDPHTLRRSSPHKETYRHSRVLLQALFVLAAFPADGTERRLADVGRQLDIAASSVHRYVTTWVAAGLLEQDLHSRRYRRAQFHTKPCEGGDVG